MLPTIIWKRQPAYETWAALFAVVVMSLLVYLLR